MNHRRFSTMVALEPRKLFASLSGTLYNDLNESRTYDPDDGETPLAGWTVYIDNNKNGRFDGGETSTTSAANGTYAFTGLSAGTYNVGVVTQATYGGTTPDLNGTSEGGFDITLRFPEEMEPKYKALFVEAAEKWESVLVRDLPNYTLTDGTRVDDVVIDASIEDIDGPGGILAQAGPDEFRRTGTRLPASGTMEFDLADSEDDFQNGELIETIIHEMGHVLGVGTVWRSKGLIGGFGTKDPVFKGPSAVREFQLLFNVSETGVPVEAGGSGGTAYSHWDEERFDEEMMTGYANYGVDDPLSRITVGSMEDLGYTVNMAAADTWDPAAGTVRKTTAVDLGGVAFARQVNLIASDAKGNVDFGYRTNTPPKITRFVVPPIAAVGQRITLSASGIVDAEGDTIAAVSFWREQNGVPGLQKNGDFYIGGKTRGKRGAFTIETSTTGLNPGQQAWYAIATDTRLTTGRKGAITSLIPMPDVPEAPGSLSGVSTSGRVAILKWSDESDSEAGFRIEIAKRNDFARDALVRSFKVPANTEGIQVTDLKPSERYYYRIRAYNIAGSSGWTTSDGPVQQLGANEILVDNSLATFTGSGWSTSTDEPGYYGDDYRINTRGRGAARFNFEAAEKREYALYVRWPFSASNASNVTLSVLSGGRVQTVTVDQSQRGGGWVYIGNFGLREGAGAVVISAAGANGNVVADAIRFL